MIKYQELTKEYFEEFNNVYHDYKNEYIDSSYVLNHIYNNTYIVLDNNKIIGFIIFAIIYDRCELIDLYIDSKYRNKGLAKNLLNIMLDNSSECNNISLEVRVDNISAYNLYLNFGFKVVSKRERYYNGIDGYLMVKEVKKQ